MNHSNAKKEQTQGVRGTEETSNSRLNLRSCSRTRANSSINEHKQIRVNRTHRSRDSHSVTSSLGGILDQLIAHERDRLVKYRLEIENAEQTIKQLEALREQLSNRPLE